MGEHWQKLKLVESASSSVSVTRDEPEFCFDERLDDGTVVGWHSHEFAQVLSPANGSVALFARKWLCILPQSHAALIPARMAHTVIASETASLRTVCFSPDGRTFKVDAGARPTIRRVPQNAAKGEGGLSSHTLIEPFVEIAPSEGSDEVRINAFLAGVPIPEDRRARPIAFRLAGALEDHRTLKEWGDALGASERTLSRIFQDEVGMSFRAWQLRLQVAGAIAALLSGNSVKRAANTVGYANPSAFVAAFKAATGQSPLQYVQDAHWD
jgi:AraC-like DNA-binding protein